MIFTSFNAKDIIITASFVINKKFKYYFLKIVKNLNC